MTSVDLGYTFAEYRTHDLDDEELAPIVALTNSFGLEREPRFRPISIEEARAVSEFPGLVRLRFVVRDAVGDPVGILTMQYPDDGTNTKVLRVSISVHAQHRRRGIGTKLLGIASEHAFELGRAALAGEIFSTMESGEAFAAAIGAERLLDYHENVLLLAELDLELMNQWVDEGPQRAPGYSVSVHVGRYPEDLLDGMAHLYHVLERDAPAPDSWEPRVWTKDTVKEFIDHFLRVGEAITAVAIDGETGHTAGMSQLFRRHSDPANWTVTTTMVDPEHRGRALGKWVKGLVNLEALRLWDGGVHEQTGNAHTNAAMLAINHAMGFREEYVMTNVEVELGAIDRYLTTRTAQTGGTPSTSTMGG
jgi:mycothiol synthase